MLPELHKVRRTSRTRNVREKVHLLWFVREHGTGSDVELLIGVYEVESDARAAIDRLKNKPGFIDFPEGFQIHSRELGQDSWEEGFVQTD
jgi:hypothetical protein